MKLTCILVVVILCNGACNAEITGIVAGIANSVLKSISTSSDALDLLKEQNKYIPSVYEWCGTAIERFSSYLRLLENFSQGKARMQHRILIQVLEVGIEKLTSAQEQLDEEAKVKLTDVIQALGEAKTQAQVTLDTIKDVEDIEELADVIRNEIKIPVEKFIEKCREYREQHANHE